MDMAKPAPKGATPEQFEASASRQLGAWLTDNAVAIVFTTYQAKVFFRAVGTGGRWTDKAPELEQ